MGKIADRTIADQERSIERFTFPPHWLTPYARHAKLCVAHPKSDRCYGVANPFRHDLFEKRLPSLYGRPAYGTAHPRRLAVSAGLHRRRLESALDGAIRRPGPSRVDQSARGLLRQDYRGSVAAGHCKSALGESYKPDSVPPEACAHAGVIISLRACVATSLKRPTRRLGRASLF